MVSALGLGFQAGGEKPRLIPALDILASLWRSSWPSPRIGPPRKVLTEPCILRTARSSKRGRATKCRTLLHSSPILTPASPPGEHGARLEIPACRPASFASAITYVNIRFEAIIGLLAQWALDQLRTSAPADFAHIARCTEALERDPYPPPALRGPLAVPGQVVYPEAYRCRQWRIAYRVEDDAFLVIDRRGRAGPPR
jgi:hypothetical protein